MKQSFKIPEGYTSVTIEQVGNQIIATFEPSQPKFKRGDVLSTKTGTICIFKDIFDDGKVESFAGVNAYRCLFEDSNRPRFAGRIHEYRHATPEEAQLLWDALTKEGKRWNPETMQVEEIKKEIWRAEPFEYYYVPFSPCGCNAEVEINDVYDDFRHKNGFYCQTEDQSERLFEKLKQAAAEFWKDELK